MADDIAVMYAGRIVEFGPKETMFASPQHPYTWGLLGSIPELDAPRDEPLVPVTGRPPSLINLPVAGARSIRAARMSATRTSASSRHSSRSTATPGTAPPACSTPTAAADLGGPARGKRPEEARADVMAGEGAA